VEFSGQSAVAAKGSAWFYFPRPVQSPSVRLFCFPHAGGNGSFVRSWPQYLPEDVEVVGIQLPGHYSRSKERPLRSMLLLLDFLEGELRPMMDTPFAFFGHSMGAAVALALTRRLDQYGRAVPVHLVVSGRCAPGTVEPRDRKLHQLSDEELLDEIKALGAAAPSLLDKSHLLDYLLPAVRADLEIIETHEHPQDQPVSAPLTTFGGEDDPLVPTAKLPQWEQQTQGEFSLYTYAGGHFFISTEEAKVVLKLGQILESTQLRTDQSP